MIDIKEIIRKSKDLSKWENARKNLVTIKLAEKELDGKINTGYLMTQPVSWKPN